jgi:hypothetical protein
MKKKLMWWFILFILLFAVYEVIIKTKTVTYFGENEVWLVQIKAKLVGLNGSHSIEIRYKGKEIIQDVSFHIHPHYDGGYVSFNNDGIYFEECKDECGYYDKSAELLFFIAWKENNRLEEKMHFIDLKKISSN